MRDRPPGDELPQLVALEELHHDEQVAVRLAEVVDGHHVGMTELGACLRLTEEPGPELVGVIALGGDDLQGNQTVEDRVVGLVDAAHAAAADSLEDPILADLLDHGRCRSRRTLMLSRPPLVLALATSSSQIFSKCSSSRATISRMA